MTGTKEMFPQGWRLKMRIDLLRNRKHLKRVIWLSFAALLVCIAGGWILRVSPISLFDGGWLMLLLRILVLVAGLVVYVAGHEAVHGVLMWFFSHQKPDFRFKLMYACAGSTAFFQKMAIPLHCAGAGRAVGTCVWLARSLGSKQLVLGSLGLADDQPERRSR